MVCGWGVVVWGSDRHYHETHGPRDHIHVACLRCGEVREVESRLYEQVKEQIARDFHMKVTVSRTEVGGYCEECLQQKNSGEGRADSAVVSPPPWFLSCLVPDYNSSTQ